MLLIGALCGCALAPTKEVRLIRAAARGDTHLVVKLIHEGADLNATDEEGWTPYLAAAVNGHWETMRALQMAGAKMDPGF